MVRYTTIHQVNEIVAARLSSKLILLSLLLIAPYMVTTKAFQTFYIQQRHYPPTSLSMPLRSSKPTTLLWASTKKGFGKTTNPPPTSSSSKSEPEPSSTTTANSPINTSNSPSEVETTTTTAAATQESSSSSSSSKSMNAGQRALQELRRQKIEERDQELRQVRDMIQADEQVQNSGPVAIPEKVAQRMGLRMLPFVGIPFFGGMITFVAFWYYATYENLQFEPTLVAASTIALLVVGLLGITYSVMSASWDPDREGSFIGWDEFQLNLDNVREGLRRSRSNAILREKMSNLSTKEVQQALQDLDKREMKK